jgi:hypothetical protein
VRREGPSSSHTACVIPRKYEVRFRGEASATVRAAFPEFDVTAADGATTLRAELPDQAALHGTLDRIQSLGLELLELRVVEA